MTGRPRSAGLDAQVQVRRGSFTLDTRASVGPGEVLGVLGPNGAGKTTLIRALAGLTRLTGGSIRLDGRALDDPDVGTFLPPEERPVGVVFQNYRLFPHLSVLDNVAFGPRSRGASRHDARDSAGQWLERFDVAEFARRRPGTLSGGQAQRVALARALASGPSLLLLDEPLSALDAGTRLAVRAELRAHLAEVAVPTLLITHDPLEAMVMTDRLLVLEAGRIVQEGVPAQVARRPATQYIARLVGLNLYTGRLRTAGRVQLDGGGELTCAGADRALRVGDRVLLALRPAAVSLHAAEPRESSPRNVWNGAVRGLEPLGDRVRVDVAGRPDALVDITPAAVADLDLRAGGQLWLTAKATDVDVYPDPGGEPARAR